jgi:hypothetical protein
MQPNSTVTWAYLCKCLTFGCLATTGVSNFQLHSNGGIRPNTSQYTQRQITTMTWLQRLITAITWKQRHITPITWTQRQIREITNTIPDCSINMNIFVDFLFNIRVSASFLNFKELLYNISWHAHPLGSSFITTFSTDPELNNPLSRGSNTK